MNLLVAKSSQKLLEQRRAAPPSMEGLEVLKLRKVIGRDLKALPGRLEMRAVVHSVSDRIPVTTEEAPWRLAFLTRCVQRGL